MKMYDPKRVFMEILGIGNAIRNGEYFVHSEFASVINFYDGSNFVSLVTPEIGNGPFNIVVNFDFSHGGYNSIFIRGELIVLKHKIFYTDSDILYHSKMNYFDNKFQDITKSISYVESEIKRISPKESLSFLLYDSVETSDFSKIEKKYFARAKFASDEILRGDTLNGVEKMKGLGPGLTPSGDDFNSGLLIALNLLQQVQKKDYTYLISSIVEHAAGQNDFSNSFIFQASHGLLSEKFKWLIDAFIRCDKEQISNSLEIISRVGKTSGFDQAVGFLFGIKRFLI